MTFRQRDPDDPRNMRVHLRRELIAAGLCDRAISARTRAGDLVRVRTGAYVDGPTYRSLDQIGRYGVLTRAVVRQARTAVVVSHVSGLPEYGAPMWGVDTSHAHITRRDGETGRRAARVQQHCGLIEPTDVIELNGLCVMGPARTALEATTMCSPEVSLGIVNYFLHSGLTSLTELKARYARMTCWPNTLHTDLVLRLAREEIESLGESRFFYLCWRQDLPYPTPQFLIRDETGEVVFRLDFAWPQYGVWLEFDGEEKYLVHRRPGESVADAKERERTRERTIAGLTGWRCLRITWSDLDHPEATAASVRRHLTPTGRPHDQ